MQELVANTCGPMLRQANDKHYRKTLESGLIQTPDLSSKVRVHGQATSVFPQGPLSTMLKLLLMPLTLSAVRFFDSGLLFCVRILGGDFPNTTIDGEI